MPHFRLETNVPKSKITPELFKNLTKAVAKTLGKPASYVVVTIVPDQLMTWNGNDKPCGTATLMSIGCLGIEENKKHAAVLYPLIEKELGIPGDRLYITFSDQSTSNVGYTGTTFHTLFVMGVTGFKKTELSGFVKSDFTNYLDNLDFMFNS